MLRRNEPGEWRVECHLREIDPDVLMAVNAVLVRDERRVIFAGYRAAGDSGQGGTLREIDAAGRRATIEGVDCWEWFRSRAVLPDPTVDIGWPVATDLRTGQGGTVIEQFIEANAGVSALPDRQIPGLTVQAAAVGTNGEWSGRHQRLDELVGRIALESNVVVEPTVTNDLEPIVYIREASDRTAEVVLSDLADLAEAEQRDVPAAATWVLAAGSGTGASRMFRSAGGGSGISRKEVVVENTNATTSNELHQFAEAKRREAGFALYVSGRTSEQAAESYEYLTDYRLGDLVTVQVKGSGSRCPSPRLRSDGLPSGSLKHRRWAPIHRTGCGRSTNGCSACRNDSTTTSPRRVLWLSTRLRW